MVRPQNRLSYLAVLEHFLGDCWADALSLLALRSKAQQSVVYDGAVNVPGLSAFSRRQHNQLCSLPRNV